MADFIPKTHEFIQFTTEQSTRYSFAKDGSLYEARGWLGRAINWLMDSFHLRDAKEGEVMVAVATRIQELLSAKAVIEVTALRDQTLTLANRTVLREANTRHSNVAVRTAISRVLEGQKNKTAATILTNAVGALNEQAETFQETLQARVNHRKSQTSRWHPVLPEEPISVEFHGKEPFQAKRKATVDPFMEEYQDKQPKNVRHLLEKAMQAMVWDGLFENVNNTLERHVEWNARYLIGGDYKCEMTLEKRERRLQYAKDGTQVTALGEYVLRDEYENVVDRFSVVCTFTLDKAGAPSKPAFSVVRPHDTVIANIYAFENAQMGSEANEPQTNGNASYLHTSTGEHEEGRNEDYFAIDG